MRDYLFYIKKRILTKKRMQFFNIIVSTLAIALIGMAVGIPQILRHGEYMIKKSLGNDISEYGVIRNANFVDQEVGSEFIMKVYNATEVDSIGFWTYGGYGYLKTVEQKSDYWKMILDIQNDHVKEFDEDPNYVQVIFMPTQAFGINDLKLYKGNKDSIGNNEDCLVFLGYNFKGIPVGTVFLDEEYGNYHVVKGIFDKGESIVDAKAILLNYGGLPLSCSVNMDNMVMIVPPRNVNFLSGDMFFHCADGHDFEDTIPKIKDIGTQLGIQAEIGKLEKRINTVLSEVDWLTDVITRFSVLLSFSAIIILLSTQLLTIISRKNELGVWFIAGLNHKQVYIIIMAENLIKMVFSWAFSVGVVMLFFKVLKSQTNASNAIAQDLRYITWGIVPLFMFVSAMVMALLCTIITMSYVKQKSVPEIVRGTWE